MYLFYNFAWNILIKIKSKKIEILLNLHVKNHTSQFRHHNSGKVNNQTRAAESFRVSEENPFSELPKKKLEEDAPHPIAAAFTLRTSKGYSYI